MNQNLPHENNIKESVWGEITDISGQEVERSIGQLKIWFKPTENDFRLAYRHAEGTVSAENSDINHNLLVWNRWVTEDKKIRIQLKPQFPDKSVVIKPEDSFKLLKDTSIKVYVRIPIWVRIAYLNNSDKFLMQLPSIILSNTWFGDYLEGELCYWISSGIRLKIEEDQTRPYMAICPIKLINNSDDDLLIEKICLRVAYLSLYLNKSQLWSDEMKILYKDHGEISEIMVAGKAPSEANKGLQLASPQLGMKKSVSAMTFQSIKDLPGLGFFIK